MSNNLKFISETEDELRVANHIVLFGGRDLEGEYFAPDTDFESDYTKAGRFDVDWEHGTHRDPDDPKGNEEILGFVDWATAKATDLGLWVERVLDRRNRYVRYLERLIKEGLVGNSTEALPDGVERNQDGKIIRWALYRDTLTVNPMEPRMLSENAIAAIKGLKLDSFINEPVEFSESSDASAQDMNNVEITQTNSNNHTTGEHKMSDETEKVEETIEETQIEETEQVDIETMKSEIVEDLKSTIEDTIKTLWDEVPERKVKPVNIKKHSHLGDPDPREDFLRWVATGESKIKKHTVMAELPDGTGGTFKAALQEGTDAEGGYLVPAGELGRIIEKRDEVALLPKVGASQFTTDRDVFNIPTEGTAQTKFTIVAEEGAISAAENENTFGQAAVTMYNFKKLLKISEELLEDYNSGLDAYLNSSLGRAWALTENYYVQVGSGSSQPQGVFVGGTAGLTLDSASAIGAAEVPELIGKLKMAYRPGAVLLMNRTTAAYLRGLTGNQFILAAPMTQPIDASGMDLGVGYPTYPTEDAAAIGASAKSMLFGNFALYGWVRNRSLRVRRLVELYAGNGQIGLLANFRAGGAVLQAEAFQYATHPTA